MKNCKRAVWYLNCSRRSISIEDLPGFSISRANPKSRNPLSTAGIKVAETGTGISPSIDLFYQFDSIVGGKRSTRCWGHAECYGMQARSRDDFLTWEKKMVMKEQPVPESPVHWDTQIWKDGDTWFQLIGGRYVLFVECGNPNWVGSYDRKEMSFTPDSPEPRYVDQGTYYSFNLHMTDDRDPGGSRRQLLHGWVTGPASPTKGVPYWQGAHSIPRIIRLQGNRLVQDPVPEIEVLRGKHHSFRGPESSDELKRIEGDALEIIARFHPVTTDPFQIELRVADDGKAHAVVAFDPKSGEFGINGRMQPSSVDQNETVMTRVFLDRSIVEVFLNGCAQTARAFPPRDARGIRIRSGGAEISTLDIWEMNGIW